MAIVLESRSRRRSRSRYACDRRAVAKVRLATWISVGSLVWFAGGCGAVSGFIAMCDGVQQRKGEEKRQTSTGANRMRILSASACSRAPSAQGLRLTIDAAFVTELVFLAWRLWFCCKRLAVVVRSGDQLSSRRRFRSLDRSCMCEDV
ncbi:hypothetical protein P154DRAFT_344707 [Amniculicola lignicola CBS 123094]|uniref:Uncharacterized protein n=1 Tax=Amniculicola lignicola CBS 123094 TaxID=1392246 RepID=A0A6A5WD06_9PLEO|nr:hypothetical protein P154DRAFT_344707 [Amniculicola lignicola CBS 123094]